MSLSLHFVIFHSKKLIGISKSSMSVRRSMYFENLPNKPLCKLSFAIFSKILLCTNHYCRPFKKWYSFFTFSIKTIVSLAVSSNLLRISFSVVSEVLTDKIIFYYPQKTFCFWFLPDTLASKQVSFLESQSTFYFTTVCLFQAHFIISNFCRCNFDASLNPR